MNNIKEFRIYTVDCKDAQGTPSFNPTLLELGGGIGSDFSSYDRVQKDYIKNAIKKELTAVSTTIYTSCNFLKNETSYQYVPNLFERIMAGKIKNAIVLLICPEELVHAHVYAQKHPEANIIVLNGVSTFYENDKINFDTLCKQTPGVRRPAAKVVLPLLNKKNQCAELPGEDVIIKPALGTQCLGMLVTPKKSVDKVLAWIDQPSNKLDTNDLMFKMFWMMGPAAKQKDALLVEEVVRAKPVKHEGIFYEPTLRYVVAEIHYKDNSPPSFKLLAGFYKFPETPMRTTSSLSNENIISKGIMPEVQALTADKLAEHTIVLKPMLCSLTQKMMQLKTSELWKNSIEQLTLSSDASSDLLSINDYEQLYHFSKFINLSSFEALSPEVIKRLAHPTLVLLFPNLVKEILASYYFGLAGYINPETQQPTMLPLSNEERDHRLFAVIKSIINTTDPQVIDAIFLQIQLSMARYASNKCVLDQPTLNEYIQLLALLASKLPNEKSKIVNLIKLLRTFVCEDTLDNIADIRVYSVDCKDRKNSETFDPVILEFGSGISSSYHAYDTMNGGDLTQSIFDKLKAISKDIYTSSKIHGICRGITYEPDLYKQVMQGRHQNCIVFFTTPEETFRAHDYAKANPKLNLIVLNGLGELYEVDKISLSKLFERAGVSQCPKTLTVVPEYASLNKFRELTTQNVIIKPSRSNCGKGSLVLAKEDLHKAFKWIVNPKPEECFTSDELFTEHWLPKREKHETPVVVQEIIEAKPVYKNKQAYEPTLRFVIQEIHYKDGREPRFELIAGYNKLPKHPKSQGTTISRDNFMSNPWAIEAMALSEDLLLQASRVLKPILLKLTDTIRRTPVNDLWIAPLRLLSKDGFIYSGAQTFNRLMDLHYFTFLIGRFAHAVLPDDIFEKLKQPQFVDFVPHLYVAPAKAYYFGTRQYYNLDTKESCKIYLTSHERDHRFVALIKNVINILGAFYATSVISMMQESLIWYGPDNTLKLDHKYLLDRKTLMEYNDIVNVIAEKLPQGHKDLSDLQNKLQHALSKLSSTQRVHEKPKNTPAAPTKKTSGSGLSGGFLKPAKAVPETPVSPPPTKTDSSTLAGGFLKPAKAVPETPVSPPPTKTDSSTLAGGFLKPAKAVPETSSPPPTKTGSSTLTGGFLKPAKAVSETSVSPAPKKTSGSGLSGGFLKPAQPVTEPPVSPSPTKTSGSTLTSAFLKPAKATTQQKPVKQAKEPMIKRGFFN